jgi:hypothetical protein
MGRFEINSRKRSKNPKTGNRVLFDHESNGGEETDNEPNEWIFRPLRHPKRILARLHGVEAHYEAMEGWSKPLTSTLADDQFDLSWVAK